MTEAVVGRRSSQRRGRVGAHAPIRALAEERVCICSASSIYIGAWWRGAACWSAMRPSPVWPLPPLLGQFVRGTRPSLFGSGDQARFSIGVPQGRARRCRAQVFACSCPPPMHALSRRATGCQTTEASISELLREHCRARASCRLQTQAQSVRCHPRPRRAERAALCFNGR